MAFLPTLAVSLLLASPQVPAPSPLPLETPIPIQCLDASGKPLPEAADPLNLGWREGAVTVPKIRKRVEPRLPWRTPGCKRPVTVHVEALITSKGDVCDTIVIDELSPECEPFGQALRGAVKKWKWEPARLGERPVPVYLVVTSTFQ